MLRSDFVPEVVCCGRGFKFLQQTTVWTLSEQLNCLCLRSKMFVFLVWPLFLFFCMEQRMITAHKNPTFSLSSPSWPRWEMTMTNESELNPLELSIGFNLLIWLTFVSNNLYSADTIDSIFTIQGLRKGRRTLFSYSRISHLMTRTDWHPSQWAAQCFWETFRDRVYWLICSSEHLVLFYAQKRHNTELLYMMTDTVNTSVYT